MIIFFSNVLFKLKCLHFETSETFHLLLVLNISTKLDKDGFFLFKIPQQITNKISDWIYNF